MQRFSFRHQFEADAAANTTFDADLPRGGILTQVRVNAPSGSVPVRVIVDVFPKGVGSSYSLDSRWVRGHSNFPGSGAFKWDGYAPLAERTQPKLQVLVRNDGGSNVTLALWVAGFVP
jgi:hypothetical protein